MKKLLLIAGLVGVCLQASSIFAQNASYIEVAHVQIRSAANASGVGKCIEVYGGQAYLGAPIVQDDCNNSLSQRFSIYYYGLIQTNLTPQLCVGRENTPIPGPNELLRLTRCDDNNYYEAHWRLDTSINKFEIDMFDDSSFPSKQFCWDVPSGSPANNIWIQTYACTGGINQAWDILK